MLLLPHKLVYLQDPSLTQTFAQATQDGSKRAIKCQIVNETIVETDSFPASSDAVADFEKVREYFKGLKSLSLPHLSTPPFLLRSSSDFECCFVLFHLDMNDPHGWIFMRFVSERAQVRKKMLYSSTSNPLKMALGANAFQWSFTGVDKDNMSIEAFIDENSTTFTEGAKDALKVLLDARTSSATAEELQREAEFHRQQEYELLTREEQARKDEARQQVHTGGSSSLSYPVHPDLAGQLAKFKSGEVSFIELV